MSDPSQPSVESREVTRRSFMRAAVSGAGVLLLPVAVDGLVEGLAGGLVVVAPGLAEEPPVASSTLPEKEQPATPSTRSAAPAAVVRRRWVGATALRSSITSPR